MRKMNPMYDFIQRNRVLAKIEKAHHTKAVNLALDDFDLSSFPEILLNCTELSSLNLGHNRLTCLSPRLTQLGNLQNISLEYNLLDKFPEVLQDLPNLKTLNVSHNPIKSLTNVGKLSNLEVLWCNSCCLSSLPEEIGSLVKLDTLGARHNQISNLPKSIGSLEKLRWLTLEDNKLHLLPKKFECLQQLIHLNLNKNNFSNIPVQLTKLKSLRYLHLQSNELYSLTESIILSMEYVKINLLKNPLTIPEDLDKVFPNLVLPGKEVIFRTIDDLDFVLDSDSSSDDWENSLGSSELNYSLSDSGSDYEEAVIEIPKLSKYLVTF